MAQAVPGTLKKTPLNARHRSLGARMVEFGGWDMPVEYSGVVDEHMAVRSRAGLFDVSHMGEIEIAGRDALKAVQHITSNDASRLSQHQAQYSALTTPDGTFVDDVLTYKLGEEHFMFVVNASNIIKDFTWIVSQINGLGDVVAVNTSSRYALMAIQGPAARDILQKLTGVNLGEIKYYWFTTGEVASVAGTISRTGYTGEDGFEVFVPPAQAERVWDAILAAGRDAGLVPAGLAARDTLRLEAAMRLYGNDMDETTTVLEADLGWIVGWKKEDVHRRRGAAPPEGGGRAAQAGRLRGARPGHRAPRARGVRERRARRRGHERHADAVPEEVDRHGVPACRVGRRRDRVRDRRARPPPAGAGRADAVLQAPAVVRGR